VTSALFAVGIVLISTMGGYVDFEAVLFGDVLGVTEGDVLIVLGVAVATGLAVFLRCRQLLFTTFDPEVAEVSGVSVALTDALLAVILAATITATMNVVGVTLIAAILVIPPVIARLMTDSFHRMLWISTGIGGLCGFVGVYLSYYLDWPSGATVVLAAAVVFVVVWGVSGFRRGRIADVGLDVH
jgi:manganese/iron transport system permease protein/iron/zinc/copper transport system permease protein